MSGPYQFSGRDSVRSPLDQPRPPPFSQGQPPSFKTNVNRMKTKKWVEAKPTSYDGDDWGEYDEYDEYGTQTPPPPPAPYNPGSRMAEPSRSFTDPQRQPPPHDPARRNSFDDGEEQRAFSAAISDYARNGGYGEVPVPVTTPKNQSPYAPPPQQSYGTPSSHPGQPRGATRQSSMAESDASDTPQHRRDFSPSAMPPPLHTRISPAPGSATGSPSSRFPARKSSLGQADLPSSPSTATRERAPSNPGKPLPFIRPADIYKRVEEERQRERASLESSRPSLDSLSSPVDRPSAEALEKGSESGRSLKPLEPVAERKSEYLQDFNVPSGDPKSEQPSAPSAPGQQSSLPQVPGVEAFDNDFWANSPQTRLAIGQESAASQDDPGFRSVVSQAFIRSDDSASVPPTPISKESESGVSRSNTDSTAGISPIMSRVPSSAASAVKSRITGADSNTPAIAEEVSESSTPVSRPVSTAMLGGPYQVPRKPSPSHSRNVSNTSLPPGALSSPSPGESPARSPAIEPQRNVPDAEAGVISTLNPTSTDTMDGGLGGPSAAYAEREADIANAMKLSPTHATPSLGAAEKESQTAFLDSHRNSDPINDAVPHSRSESPSKGRVQALAGKFGEVSHSRRGSTQSNASRDSLQSWERSQNNSRPSSPTKPSAARGASPVKDLPSDRPAAAREASFRPKLPGTWESYATTVPTPSEQSDRVGQFASSKEGSPEQRPANPPLEEVDLTPTTAKHTVAAREPATSSDPLAALKAAGTAMGEAIQASVGIGSSPTNASTVRDAEPHGHAVGDVYLRPLQLDRTASSIASSAPPTPPAKDTPRSEELPPTPPMKESSPGPDVSFSQQSTPVRPSVVPQLSTDPSLHDQESDRLRKEIVASLSPLGAIETSTTEPSQSSLQAGSVSTNRESSILPSEYDSYWAHDHASPRPSTDSGSQAIRTNLEQPSSDVRPGSLQLSENAKPGLLTTRFSWEGQPATPVPPQVLAEADDEKPKDALENVASSPTTGHVEPQATSLPLTAASETYVGPSHAASTSKSDPVIGDELNAHPPTPPAPSEKPLTSPTQLDSGRAVSPPHGLHVINSSLNPEAVDLPPRLSAEASPVTLSPQTSQDPPSAHQGIREVEPQAIQEPPATQEASKKSPVSDKPLGFREIVSLKSPSERITTYNRTRDYWHSADHGLSEWVASAMAANPSVVSEPIPKLSNAPTTRHKHTPSLSLFGKHNSASAQPSTSSPYYGQYNSAASQVPSTPTSATPQSLPASSTGPGGGRSASHQMQSKGKDLLHSAGVLGGKGMTGAKGLFAKGKSRFRGSGSGDKAARPHSISSFGDVSGDLDFVTTPELLARSSVDIDSPSSQKKKRRLSSPFHRSSRSRSRPSSIILPKNTHVDIGTASMRSRDTPPRETPPPEGSQPESFCAPKSWNVTSDPQQPFAPSTPPRGSLSPPERLGILPSPAKSAFSLVPQDNEDHVPPVPPLPESWEHKERGEGVQSPAHHILQSVVRNTTPPAMEIAELQESSTTSEQSLGRGHSAEDTQAGAQEDGRISERQQEDAEDDRPPPEPTHEPAPPSFAGAESSDANVSPSSGRETPKAPAAGEMSPVSSQEGPGRSVKEDDDDDDDRPPQVALDLWLRTPQQAKSDVSPMLSAATPAGGGASNSLLSSEGIQAGRQAEERPAYETQQIGAGDVSPIASDGEGEGQGQGQGEDEAASTPTTEAAQEPHHVVTAAPSEGQAEHAPSLGADSWSDNEATPIADGKSVPLTPHALAKPPPPIIATQQRQSVSPYHVVHAVQYVPSTSSLESWDFESVGFSQSEGSQQGEVLDDRDSLVPPVPQLPQKPDIVKTSDSGPQPDEHTLPMAASKPSTEGLLPRTRMNQQMPVYRATPGPAIPGSHKRSQSLLSAISSAVSADGVPKSPVSDPSAVSRPSSSHRQPHGNTARSSPVPAPSQIVEEPPAKQDAPPTTDDDFDLYADQDGVVKDVRTESGQPLRVATIDVAASASVHQQSQQLDADTVKSRPRDPELLRKYSFERPMSFISMPRDADGRPQDQINRPVPQDTIIPPVPPIPRQAEEQMMNSAERSNESPPPIQPHLSQSPLDEGKKMQDAAPTRPGQGVRRTSHVRHSQEMRPPVRNVVSPPPPSHASPPPQATPPSSLASRPFLQDPRLQNTSGHDFRVQSTRLDPRLEQGPGARNMTMRGALPVQQAQPQDPRNQHMPEQNNQNLGLEQVQRQEPHGLREQQMREQQMREQQMREQQPPQNLQMQQHIAGQPPGTQYEVQQQMMQRQAVDPRTQATGFRPMGATLAPSNSQPSKQEEKSSSRPKIGAVFKGLGSRVRSNSPQAPAQSSNSVAQPSQVQSGAASYQAGLGDLPEQVPLKKKDWKPSAVGSLGNRPQSIGTESHISQDSTRVQAAESRLDLRYPASPAPFNGIPPSQPPPGAPLPPKQQQQPLQTSNPAIPEPGKKKRFSALGNLFNRNSAGPGTKMSKEEKKAQKAQKHGSAPLLQSPPMQQWPQHNGPPQQYGMQYGPSPPRPFPGLAQAQMPPQGIHPQGVPQHHPYTQGHPQQQSMQSQGYSQQQSLPLGYQSQAGPQPIPNGSAYLHTRELAQAHAQGRRPQQPPSNSSQPSHQHPVHAPSSSATSFHRAQPSGMHLQAPAGGYYAPSNEKRGLHNQLAPRHESPQQQPRQAPPVQQSQNNRRVSSPASTHSSHTASTAISQRHVSSPPAGPKEPRYDTPQIPAAYNHVSASHMPQGAPPPAHDNQPGRPTLPPTQHSSASSHQYSDAPMQPLSPQVSAMSQAPQDPRMRSGSSQSMVSPVSNPSPGLPSAQRPSAHDRSQQPRMSSISEASQPERPWTVDVPEGATEQEIVRARHQQYMQQLHQQQLLAQQQLHAERSGKSPSPQPSIGTQSPSPQPPLAGQQSHSPGPNAMQGFREVFPRHSPQPYAVPEQYRQQSELGQPAQPTPIHTQQSPSGVQPAAFPLPMSPEPGNTSARSPVNPLADALPPPPPPKIPHTPVQPSFPAQQHVPLSARQTSLSPVQHLPSNPVPSPPTQRRSPPPVQHVPQPSFQHRSPPPVQQTPPPPMQQQVVQSQDHIYTPAHQPPYDEIPPDEPPPSYDGPGLPNDGMDKPHEQRVRNRPPNIVPPPVATDDNLQFRGRDPHARSRQLSIAILQHPQPASMAASPQRTAPDMGAEMLRHQMLAQQEQDRLERLQREHIQRQESMREREERQRARARAMELERSVSGGGRVSSLRSASGSGRAGSGWERRGSGSGHSALAAPVFELPGEEDSEPVMHATSYPGQEWMPAWEGE